MTHSMWFKMVYMVLFYCQLKNSGAQTATYIIKLLGLEAGSRWSLFFLCSEWLLYLVCIVEEVHGHTEGQGVMIGIPQKNRKNLHTGRPGLSLALLLCPLHGALAVDGILTHLCPEDKMFSYRYVNIFIAKIPWKQLRSQSKGNENSHQ